MAENRYHFIAEASGEKLLDFLASRLPHLSKKRIKELIERGFAAVNHRQVTMASTLVAKGEEIDFEEGVVRKAEELAILYEDSHCLVVDKPAFITSEEAAKKLGRGFLVHRLDKETSGCLLFAKDPISLEKLEKAFYERTVKKEYQCIVVGEINWPKGTVRVPLAKKGAIGGQVLWGKKEGGARAVTDWELVKKSDGLSYLRVFPRTGRTHQIRIHLLEIGFPILGDKLYGAAVLTERVPDRLMLHARALDFPHPVTCDRIIVDSPLPNEFQEWFSL